MDVAWKLAITAASLLVSSVSHATTVRALSLDGMARGSHIIVRAHVSYVDERAGQRNNKFRTAIGFEIDEVIKGLAPDTSILELELPGGRNGALTMAIPGTPAFATGQEVVVLLTRVAHGYTVTGLQQGVFNVSRYRGQARANRGALSQMRLIDDQGKTVNTDRVDVPLAELLGQFREATDGQR